MIFFKVSSKMLFAKNNYSIFNNINTIISKPATSSSKHLGKKMHSHFQILDDIMKINIWQVTSMKQFISYYRAGQLDYHLALNVSTYLVRENSYVPWKAFIDSVEFLRGILSTREAYGLLEVVTSDHI